MENYEKFSFSVLGQSQGGSGPPYLTAETTSAFARVVVPDTTVSASNTGSWNPSDPSSRVKTIWTQWKGINYQGAETVNWQTWAAEVPVAQISMSFWCADCHNLNVAYKEIVDEGFGGGKYGNNMLSDRAHASPNMLDKRNIYGTHCYACHRNDMEVPFQNLTYHKRRLML